jgi:Reverse transcriptase (RNA-dependent DNA polymerase)/Endonuclease-reverse transcriptase
MEFRVLQYNVHKSKAVLEPLIASYEASKVDIIAIQEPWHSTFTSTSYCPKSCPFYLIYLDKTSRVSLYINKKYSTDSWTFKFLSKDLLYFELLTSSLTSIKIINCYSEPPTSYTTNNLEFFSISLLPQVNLNSSLFTTSNNIVLPSTLLLGDFNLHHPDWFPKCLHSHTLSFDLIHYTTSSQLQQLTPPGLTTFVGRGETTIDLAFASQHLSSHFISCSVPLELCFNSDHNPVLLTFFIQSSEAPMRLNQWNWRKIDKDLTRLLADDLPQVPTILSTTDLDNYLHSLHDSLDSIVHSAVPLTKAKKRQQPPWWTLEIDNVISQEREQRKRWTKLRIEGDNDILRELSTKKAKLIRKTKRRQWRKLVHQASTNNNMWSLAKWARGASKEPPILPPLLENNELLYTAKQKTSALFNRFYITPQADLSDIQEAFPPIYEPFSVPLASVHHIVTTSTAHSPTTHFHPALSPLATEFTPGATAHNTQRLSTANQSLHLASPQDVSPPRDSPPHASLSHASLPLDSPPHTSLRYDFTVQPSDISEILQSRKPFSCPGLDQIPYVFLKALGPPFISIIVLLSTYAFKLGYFPSRYKKARTIVIRKPSKPDYSLPKAWRPIALLSTLGKIIEAIIARKLRNVAEENKLFPKEQMGFRSQRSTEHALDLLTSQIQLVTKSKAHIPTLLSLDISGAFDSVVPERLIDVLRKMGFPIFILSLVTTFIVSRSTTLLLPSGEESSLLHIGNGLPQGSPLSVVLFTLYNASLFSIFQKPKEGISPVGFADDLNVLAYSTSTEVNCEKLKRCHSEAMKWSKKFGLNFAPDKYELIHFSRASKRFNLQASINLGDITKEPTKLVRVLGLWLDPALSWKGHIEKTRQKAVTQLKALTTLASPTWGLTFIKARQIYLSVVSPLLTYNASVWSTSLSPTTLLPLERIQNQALRAITGAYKATPIHTLEVEAFIPPLKLRLKKLTQASYERNENSILLEEKNEALLWIRKRTKPKRGRQRSEAMTEVNRKEVSCEEVNVLDHWKAHWLTLPRDKLAITQAPTAEILLLHKGLFKSESSMLIQLRTGRIGLPYFLHKRKVPEYPTPFCPCSQGIGSVSHFLTSCTLHLRTREQARQTKEQLLVEQPKATAQWAIQTGALPQFALARILETKIQPVTIFWFSILIPSPWLRLTSPVPHLAHLVTIVQLTTFLFLSFHYSLISPFTNNTRSLPQLLTISSLTNS